MKKKFTLVLDLDETLIHCNSRPLNLEAIPLKLTNQEIYLHVRPFAREFIQ